MAGSTGTEGNWMCFLCNKTGLSRLSSWKGKKTVGKSVKPAPGGGQVSMRNKQSLFALLEWCYLF